jgi:hypothetical protein
MAVAKAAHIPGTHDQTLAAAGTFYLGPDGLTTTSYWFERDPWGSALFFGLFDNDTTGVTNLVVEHSDRPGGSVLLTNTYAGANGGPAELPDGIVVTTPYPYFRVKVTVVTDDTNLAYLVLLADRNKL